MIFFIADKDECSNSSVCNINGQRRQCVNLPGSYQCIEEVNVQDKDMIFDTGQYYCTE